MCKARDISAHVLFTINNEPFDKFECFLNGSKTILIHFKQNRIFDNQEI